MSIQSSVLRTFAFSCAVILSSAVHADIIGFGNFAGFTINQADVSAAPTVSPGTIQLTNLVNTESRSIFANVPQNISQFTASFTYQSLDGVGGFGVAFVLQNSTNGAQTVALAGQPSFGYGFAFNKSTVLSLEYFFGTSKSGLYMNGQGNGGSNNTTPLNMVSNPINATLTYDGTLLHETLTDSAASASYSTSYVVNLPSILGGNTAYVGFTGGGSGNGGNSRQFLSDFTFVNVPEPCSSLLCICAIGFVVGRRCSRRRKGGSR